MSNDGTIAEAAYYLWDTKYSLWWRAKGGGYTDDLRQAGHFEKEDECVGASYGNRRVLALPRAEVDKLKARLVVEVGDIERMVAAMDSAKE